MAGISIWQLMIVVVIVVLLFGTKKLGSLGADLGASIKGFKKALHDDDEKPDTQETLTKDADFPPLSPSKTQDDRVKT